MATNNPTYTAADIVTDVNSRFSGSTGLSSDVFLPWISYAYQKLYNKIISVGSRAKQDIFGDRADVTLSADTLEYSLTTNIPRFGGFIKVEVIYGASGDVYNRASPLIDLDHWDSLSRVSVTYRSKTKPLYYRRLDQMGIIPTPTAGETTQTPTARVWFVKRPFQVDTGTDEIDIPYRFIYPMVNYVHSKTIQRVNEDYREAELVEARFDQELEEVADMVANEFEEGEDGIEISSGSDLYQNPLSY